MNESAAKRQRAEDLLRRFLGDLAAESLPVVGGTPRQRELALDMLEHIEQARRVAAAAWIGEMWPEGWRAIGEGYLALGRRCVEQAVTIDAPDDVGDSGRRS